MNPAIALRNAIIAERIIDVMSGVFCVLVIFVWIRLIVLERRFRNENKKL